jgi:hypothetical protein
VLDKDAIDFVVVDPYPIFRVGHVLMMHTKLAFQRDRGPSGNSRTRTLGEPVPTGQGEFRFRLTTTYLGCPADSKNQLDPTAVVIRWRSETRACDSRLTPGIVPISFLRESRILVPAGLYRSSTPTAAPATGTVAPGGLRRHPRDHANQQNGFDRQASNHKTPPIQPPVKR